MQITNCKMVTQHNQMPYKGNYPDSSTCPHSWEDVVISGVSCRLPKSENIAEFRDNLMKGVDMTSDDEMRWKEGTSNNVDDLRLLTIDASEQYGHTYKDVYRTLG